MTKDKYAKVLRQKIMANAATQGWDYDEMHGYLENWGYGNSLRKLRISELKEVLKLVKGEEVQQKHYGVGQLDQHGKYMWFLMKEAGWNWERVRKLMLKKYKATHWNALNVREKRGIINILKRYGAKNEKNS